MSESSIPLVTSLPTAQPSSLSSVSQDPSPTTNSSDSLPPVEEPSLTDSSDAPLLALLDTKLDQLTDPVKSLAFVTELRSLRTNPAAMRALRMKEGSALEGKRKASKAVVNQVKVEQANDDLFAKLGIM